jgi:predicted metal-dependent TIM-barrel fold hydrolase
MANIAFSTPFTRSFTHANHSVTTTKSKILDVVEPSDSLNKRVMVVVQNKDTSTNVDIIFNSVATVGLTLLPNQSCTIENYNGVVFAKSAAGTITVHTAVALV